MEREEIDLIMPDRKRYDCRTDEYIEYDNEEE